MQALRSRCAGHHAYRIFEESLLPASWPGDGRCDVVVSPLIAFMEPRPEGCGASVDVMAINSTMSVADGGGGRVDRGRPDELRLHHADSLPTLSSGPCCTAPRSLCLWSMRRTASVSGVMTPPESNSTG